LNHINIRHLISYNKKVSTDRSPSTGGKKAIDNFPKRKLQCEKGEKVLLNLRLLRHHRPKTNKKG